MNTLMKATLLAGLTSASIVAVADIDYTRIKKDVTVMTQILKSAFDANGKPLRGVRVDGNYLAEQGAVFTIQAPRSLRGYSFRLDEDGGDYQVFGGWEEDAVFLDVPAIVSDALANVSINLEGLEGLEGLESLGELERLRELEGLESHRHDRESRLAVREMNREVREIEREISENRIELIHADDDEKREINRRIEKLDEQLIETRKKQEAMAQVLEERMREVREKREALREKAVTAQKEQFAKVEDTIMNALCDYGSALRNLPDDDHVSVILERLPSSSDRQVYVFDKDEVTDCNSDGRKLAQKSTRYVF